MTRRAQKQQEQLDTLESSFKRRLIAELQSCAEGHNSLMFLTSVMRPASWPRSVESPVADELLEIAGEILAVRAKCGLSVDDCLAERFAEACRRHVDLDDHNRLGARRQAERLLAEISGSR